MDAVAPDRPVRAVVIDDTDGHPRPPAIVLSRAAAWRWWARPPDGRAGRRAWSARERPDVVLLDLAMPVMDGVEALPLIRELVPDARIIVLSAFARRVRRAVLAPGADGYLEKGTSAEGDRGLRSRSTARGAGPPHWPRACPHRHRDNGRVTPRPRRRRPAEAHAPTAWCRRSCSSTAPARC